MKNKILALVFSVISISALGIAGKNDFRDQQDQQEHYCKMVESGAWPDYKDDVDCENSKTGVSEND